MLPQQTIEKIEQLATEVAMREGVQLYDVEFTTSGGRTLRVFIEKEGGVGIEDCSQVSRGLNLLLDVEDLIPGGNYNLEVSSPGLDRKLSKPWHFEKVIGKKIWIRLSKSLEALGVANSRLKPAKQLQEVLAKSDSEAIYFSIEGEDIRVPYVNIEKAKLIFEEEIKPKGIKKKF